VLDTLWFCLLLVLGNSLRSLLFLFVLAWPAGLRPAVVGPAHV